MGLDTDPLHFAVMVGLMCLVGVTFSSMGLYLAALAKESTNFQLLITVISLPLTFLSGAYIPTMVMPGVLRPIIYLNPLTYMTAAFRYVALKMEGLSANQLVQAGVAFNIHGFIVRPYLGAVLVLVMGAVFFALCVNQFNQADFSRVKVFRHGHR
jgi:ABC-2 type transport system permease protein